MANGMHCLGSIPEIIYYVSLTEVDLEQEEVLSHVEISNSMPDQEATKDQGIMGAEVVIEDQDHVVLEVVDSEVADSEEAFVAEVVTNH